MAKDKSIPAMGTRQEQELFTEVNGHYQMAREDLDVRIPDFNKKDILFRSHIEENKWPYQAIIFDPRIFTALYEKTSRMFANKPKGRMVPREGGDALGARINNELLSFQWDENERIEATTMLAKWALMDLNARKYGASFGVVKWHYEQKKNPVDKKMFPFYDGPQFIPLSNRDCLANPSYSTVKNWFQHRDYVTLQELQSVNDAARSKPIYKNLDILKSLLSEESKAGGDQRSTNYVIKNKTIKGLTDFLGRDEVYRTVEIITEYSEGRWVTFSPKHGIILRDIPNPYAHGQIPVIQLKYYPIDDDLYGLSEIEPVEKLQRATNALVSQYMDSINMGLYSPLKVRQTGGAVQMHTLEFGPGKKWLMNDPQTDVIAHEQGATGVTEFTSTYRFLISAMQEALGETSQGISNLVPGGDKKTATEIRDTAISRSARDNFNQLFLSDALKKQMGFWHVMNKQFLFSNPKEHAKIIRIVGKDAIAYFEKAGLDGVGMSAEFEDMIADPGFDDEVLSQINLKDFEQPIFPVQLGNEVVPKFNMEDDGSSGEMLLEPEDLSGTYDYIPDIESMQIPDKNQMINAQEKMIEILLNPASQQQLANQRYKVNLKEVIEDYFEMLGKKDTDKYFEKLEVSQFNGQTQQAGAGGIVPGQSNMVNGGVAGVQGSPIAPPNGQAQPVVSRPV